MIVKNRIKPDIKLEDTYEAKLAQVFEDGTKAGLTLAIKQLEQLRDTLSIAEVLREAQGGQDG
jgi:hypothetical protein